MTDTSSKLAQIRSRIKKVDNTKQHLKILVYGEPGVGKTSLYGKAKDTLVLDVEQGTSVLPLDSEVDIFQLTCWEDLQEVFSLLQSGELKYTNIVLDSITEIQELCKDYILRSQKRNRVSEDTPSQQDYGELVEKMRKMLRNFRALPSNLIFIARVKNFRDQMTGEERFRPLLVGQLQDDLPAAMDIVGYLAADETGKRVMFFDLIGKYVAKDRTHRLGKKMENPDWDKLSELLPELNPDNYTVRGEVSGATEEVANV